MAADTMRVCIMYVLVYTCMSRLDENIDAIKDMKCETMDVEER